MAEPADQIFISYSRRDARLADRVAAALTAAGFSVWIDRAGIRGGELWRQRIVSAINECRSFVLLISPHSIQSDNVRKELDLAEQAGRAVFPAILAQADIPDTLQYQLAGVQSIDLQADFQSGVAQLLSALGAESSEIPQRPAGVLRSAFAGAGAVALCAAVFPLSRQLGLLGETGGVAASLASSVPAWLWKPGPLIVVASIASLVAFITFRTARSRGAGASRVDAHRVEIALLVYLLLVVPGTVLLGQYPAAAVALIAAAGAWIAHRRSGRMILSLAAAVAIALLPAMPVLGDAILRASSSSSFEKADLYLPNPCVKAEDIDCDPPVEAPDLADEALRSLAGQMRRTVANVFGEVRALLQDGSAERTEAEHDSPLLQLVNTVELHDGCAAGPEDADRRLYAFLMSPRLMMQDGRVLRIKTPIGFSACRPEFELESLKAARILLERIQALDRYPFAGEDLRDRREFSDEEVLHIRRQIVLGWYIALKNRAIESTYPPADWASQKSILDERIEKERIARVYPDIYDSEAFARADFIWRGDRPAFTDDDVKQILDTFPPVAAAEAETEGRVALTSNLSSLTGTAN